MSTRRIQEARREGRLGIRIPPDEVLDAAIADVMLEHYKAIDERIAAGENRVVARDPFLGTESVHQVPSFFRAPRRRLKIAISRWRYRRATPVSERPDPKTSI